MKPYKEKIIEKKASFFKRLLAFGVDLFVLNFIIVSPFASVIETNSGVGYFSEISSTLMFIVVLISLLALAYFVLMEWYFNKTLGMMLLKIEASGNMSLLNTFVRHLYLIPIFPFSLLIFLDPIWLVFKGERLSEKLTKTKTIERIRVF